MLPRTGGNAVSYAKSQAERRVYWRPGLCLKFSRTCFNVAAKYPDAKTAWHNAKHRHPPGQKRPPAATLVFFRIGVHWHVAPSVGNGNIATTDFPILGYIGVVPIIALEREWNCVMEGWTEDVNDVRVWQPPRLDLSDMVKCARTEPGHPRLSQHPVQVKALARALNKAGLLSSRNVTGHYSVAKKRAYANWQRRLGMTGGAADGIPGERSLRALCTRFGYEFRK